MLKTAMVNVHVVRSEGRDVDSPIAENNAGIPVEYNDRGNPDWHDDKRNPSNWTTGKKAFLVSMGVATAFTTSVATSIVSPAKQSLAKEFGIGRTLSLLPLSVYVFALAFGPVLGSPLAEIAGRMPIFYIGYPLGALFTIGCGLSRDFLTLCIFRFLAGVCWAPTLAVATGSVSEAFELRARGPIIALIVLMPFLGLGFGPILGSFAMSRLGWRWTQWILLFLSVFCIVLIAFTKETLPDAIRRRKAKGRNDSTMLQPSPAKQLGRFIFLGLRRPLHMLLAEPIVALTCLYTSINFGILFSFFTAVPYTFDSVFNFSIEQSGLVFSSIIVGCLLGLLTVFACELLVYQRVAARYPCQKPPPEHRLYPAMMGSFGLPVGLFWYAWAARPNGSWVSVVSAIVPYAWGNICVFIPCMQYLIDIYHPDVASSVLSANSLTRYGFSGAFPLFTIQMYEKLGIDWGTSLFGFVAVALLPIPWLLYKFGPGIRTKSQHGTNHLAERPVF